MVEFLRTEIIETGFDRNLSLLCHNTKNLYNAVNYDIRQQFFQQKKIPTYFNLCKSFQNIPEYKALPGHTAQQTLKSLAKDWISFNKANQAYNRNPRKFLTKPRIPGFKKKNGENSASFTAYQIRVDKNGYLKLPKKVNFKIKTRLSDKSKIQFVRVIPKGVGYHIEIVYKRNFSPKNPSRNKKAAIDFGVVNIITMVDNVGSRPIVIKDDGKGLKAITQYYLKERARLHKIYKKQGISKGKKLDKLITKYERKKSDLLHKISKFVIQECERKNIGVLIIGYNPEWKQKINLGRKTNQTFVSIPYNQLIEKIRYKAEERGIVVRLVDESYTSKCSFLDNEPIKKHMKYQGRRTSRGVFKSSTNLEINADVNAAYNILLKSDPQAIPQRKADGVGGYVVYPFSWNSF